MDSSSEENGFGTAVIVIATIYMICMTVLLCVCVFQLVRLFVFAKFDPQGFRARKIFHALLLGAIFCSCQPFRTPHDRSHVHALLPEIPGRILWYSLELGGLSETVVGVAIVNGFAGTLMFYAYSSVCLFWADLIYTVKHGIPGAFFHRFKVLIIGFFVATGLFLLGLLVTSAATASFSLAFGITTVGFSLLFASIAVVSAIFGIKLRKILDRLNHWDPSIISGKRVLCLSLACSLFFLIRACWNIGIFIGMRGKPISPTIGASVVFIIELCPIVCMLSLIGFVGKPEGRQQSLRNPSLERPLVIQ